MPVPTRGACPSPRSRAPAAPRHPGVVGASKQLSISSLIKGLVRALAEKCQGLCVQGVAGGREAWWAGGGSLWPQPAALGGGAARSHGGSPAPGLRPRRELSPASPPLSWDVTEGTSTNGQVPASSEQRGRAHGCSPSPLPPGTGAFSQDRSPREVPGLLQPPTAPDLRGKVPGRPGRQPAAHTSCFFQLRSVAKAMLGHGFSHRWV